ncbi:family 20 glycosylhydrolase [Granulicatella sp. zg-ZJ]|uniref:family 20 glycosylhydrolase n=1 Tax=Granulicatella sp. zg-ZJ TaxID=2678504 RepID=UPI0013D89ADE|nr:family 20 glycosylhydrolase [Granulicatella sp. zg-ZJ]NEW62378.1 family 20 glycosylhydrolase [Granulicatella sp. zg-ZJ]
MRKWIQKWIKWLMVVVLFVGISPSLKAYSDQENYMRVFSIDAGRKYFSLEQLKQLVDKAQELGFTDLHVLLGNDGLRFVLDDMEITTNSKTYPSNAVKEAIKEGNRSYYNDRNGDALTQAEMTELLAYAASKKVSIIPAVNSPGHMDAILVAMEKLGIANPFHTNNGISSDRTLDITNTEAVDFTKQLVKKYANYFSGKVRIFNFGADEFANDLYTQGTNGFKALQSKGLYKTFGEYVNALAQIIKDANLQPMAFNDGFYYNNSEEVTFDKDIIISYWTSGWNGYNVASAKTLSAKGHKILNTNDAWYYVVGRDYSGSGWYNLQQGLDGVQKAPFRQVAGTTYNPDDPSANVNIIGSMVCTWCDTPSRQYKPNLAFRLMQAFATKNADVFAKKPNADYAKVDALLARVPKDLTIYNTNVVDALTKLINSIDRTKTNDQQEEVNEYAKQLEELLNTLELKPADYTALIEGISKIPQDLDNYTEETVENLTNFINNIDETKNITQQSDVDAYVEQLEDLVKALTLKKADYTALDKVVATVPKDLDNYTEESVKALTDFINDIDKTKNITQQSDVDAYVKQLEDLIKALALKKADYTALDKVVATVPKDLDSYTEESVKALTDFINNVDKTKNITQQSDVDAYVKQLEDLVKALTLKKADYTALDKVLATVPKDLDSYTEESVKALTDFIKNIDKTKNITQQNDVNHDVEKLEETIKALVLKKSPVLPHLPKDAEIEYMMIDGNNQTISAGQTLRMASNADFNKFVSVMVDGKMVDKSMYTVKSGSTIVTLSNMYTATLTTGKHQLSIVSRDGKAVGTFYVKKATVKENTNIKTNSTLSKETTKNKTLVKTGEQMALWTMFIGLLCIGVAVWLKKQH